MGGLPRDNNVLPWGNQWMRRVNVIKDPLDPDADRRYKMTYVDVFDGRTAITKGCSRAFTGPATATAGPGSTRSTA